MCKIQILNHFIANLPGHGYVRTVLRDKAGLWTDGRYFLQAADQLKGSGIVDSKRGFYGGYFLVKPPNEVSVGDVLRFLQREQLPTDCIACVSKTSCPFNGQCAFSSMWIRVKQAAFNIYDETSFQDLIDREQGAGRQLEQ